MEIDIRGALKKRKLTIIELADRLKVSRRAIYDYIDKGDNISFSKLEIIASAIGVPVTDLLKGGSTEIKCPNCGAKLEVKVKNK